MGEQLFAEEGSQHAQGRAVNVRHRACTEGDLQAPLLHLPGTELCARVLALCSLNQQGFPQELIFFISN